MAAVMQSTFLFYYALYVAFMCLYWLQSADGIVGICRDEQLRKYVRRSFRPFRPFRLMLSSGEGWFCSFSK
jgi:hypothetical protein